MKIKVCGMISPWNLEQVCALEPDFVGFIFYPGSKRFVGESPDPALFQIPGPGIRKVGVFVNESVSSVKEAFGSKHLHMVQLHGDESPDYCRTLSKEGIPVVKALDVQTDLALLEEYREQVDYFLFDTKGPGYGGTGQKFDWDLLRKIPSGLPFLLGGGIGPGDAGAVLDMDHGGLLGVDLNSLFEVSPGIKDVGMLRDFMVKIKKQ
jgi:phosphoribosylanthranilate isomerase